MTKLDYNNIFESCYSKEQAKEYELRADILCNIRDIVEDQEWTPQDVAILLKIPQNKADDILSGKFKIFTSSELNGYMQRLGPHIKGAF